MLFFLAALKATKAQQCDPFTALLLDCFPLCSALLLECFPLFLAKHFCCVFRFFWPRCGPCFQLCLAISRGLLVAPLPRRTRTTPNAKFCLWVHLANLGGGILRNGRRFRGRRGFIEKTFRRRPKKRDLERSSTPSPDHSQPRAHPPQNTPSQRTSVFLCLWVLRNQHLDS